MMIIPCPSSVRRIVNRPAIYGFGAIQNISDDEIRIKKLPKTIRAWGWHSAAELYESATIQLQIACQGKPVAEKILDLRDFLDLYLPDPALFSWFILYGEGILQVNRPRKACAFDDECLYVPADWGKAVLAAVTKGFYKVIATVENKQTILYGTDLNDVRGDASFLQASS